MVDKELLSRKISRLRTYTEALMSAEDIDWEKYKSDLRAKAFVERYLHLAIEEVIDIANHLISFFKWREPAGYRDLFQILKEHGIMSEKDLPTFQNMASFRNMLVHRYETIDEELVFGLFKKRLDDFELFIRMVVNWVERQKE
jgi:uncharacterized protein YutE (UPF0331/DUF86 family)